MSPGNRCDEVIRLIDQALADDEPAREEPLEQAAPEPHGVEELPGHWGVYYLRPCD